MNTRAYSTTLARLIPDLLTHRPTNPHPKAALREAIEGYKIRPLEKAIADAEECDKFDHKGSRW